MEAVSKLQVAKDLKLPLILKSNSGSSATLGQHKSASICAVSFYQPVGYVLDIQHYLFSWRLVTRFPAHWGSFNVSSYIIFLQPSQVYSVLLPALYVCRGFLLGKLGV